MSRRLFDHINQYVAFGEKEFERALSFFEEHSLKKKEIVSRGGEICRNLFFVDKGCLHMFYTHDKGAERTVQFAIENWWLTDYLAFHQKTLTPFSIQAVESSSVLSISAINHEKLLAEYPHLEKYFRIILQISYGASIMRTKFLNDFSKEEIYFHFTTRYPEFAQRVPQYLIASFLGLTPEYVSEIRSKKRS